VKEKGHHLGCRRNVSLVCVIGDERWRAMRGEKRREKRRDRLEERFKESRYGG
jgi:hypothetical protein